MEWNFHLWCRNSSNGLRFLPKPTQISSGGQTGSVFMLPDCQFCAWRFFPLFLYNCLTNCFGTVSCIYHWTCAELDLVCGFWLLKAWSMLETETCSWLMLVFAHIKCALIFIRAHHKLYCLCSWLKFSFRFDLVCFILCNAIYFGAYMFFSLQWYDIVVFWILPPAFQLIRSGKWSAEVVRCCWCILMEHRKLDVARVSLWQKLA